MGKIRVLPVYPEFPLTFWSFKTAVEYVGKKAAMPPTGLATVLAMLPEDEFLIHRIIDLNVEPLTDQQIKDCDLVFTSSMIVQEESHNEIIDRAHLFGKKVVAGGPFPTSYPERNHLADFFVGGEAEVSLYPFVEDLLNGNPQRTYSESELVNSGRSRVELTKKGKPIVANTPLPRWDLVNLNQYVSAAVQYSRGCPFDCEFCDITKLFGRESRTKTPEQMISEFEVLYRKGFRGPLFIVDDNFIGNKANVRKLLPAVIEWQKSHRFPYTFFTEASINLAWPGNTDILRGMVEAGFDEVFVGIESVDDEVLKAMGKGQNTVMPPLEAIRRIQAAGLSVTGGFIVGSDGEKPEMFEQLFNFIQEASIVIPMPGLLTAVRGTNLYHRLGAEGRLRGESRGNNTHHLAFNFITQQDEGFLINGYKELLLKLFNDKNYYQRCRGLHERIGPSKARGHAQMNYLVAFGKSLKRQLFARGGWQYGKYLAECALKHPKQFPMAVSHAIKLDHFKTITRASLEVDEFQRDVNALYEQFEHSAKRIISDYREVRKVIDLIRQESSKVVARAEQKIEKLHEDFRQDAEQALDRLKERVNSDIERYCQSLGLEFAPV